MRTKTALILFLAISAAASFNAALAATIKPGDAQVCAPPFDGPPFCSPPDTGISGSTTTTTGSTTPWIPLPIGTSGSKFSAVPQR
ncbi:hypothetical protein J5226_06045 [Lysobacter sp. K5869]|uniref:hypothetical protein n=1 Tax=Lysobacter sp. K5869 TaxID=2820808 RepID=UPI001C0610F2|nr:hypothetical protein [Lysobacter sp. K5869]QWP77965.1 hypothetical protein J5226_06045 [Lysobacter sp. K5869]